MKKLNKLFGQHISVLLAFLAPAAVIAQGYSFEMAIKFFSITYPSALALWFVVWVFVALGERFSK